MIFKPLSVALMIQLGLPLPPLTLRAPTALEWRHRESAEAMPDGSLRLSQDLAGEVLAHLRYAEKYPELCQEIIDQQHAIDEADKKKALEAEEAKRGVPGWLVPVGAAAGLVLGVLGTVFVVEAVR